MTELSLDSLRGAATAVGAVATSVEHTAGTVGAEIAGGPECAGAAYAEAGGLYAAHAQPRVQAVLTDYLAVLRNTAAALTATTEAYQQNESAVVASLNAIPTPWT